jgi:hypothetical protein
VPSAARNARARAGLARATGVRWDYLQVDPEDGPSRTTNKLGYHLGGGVDLPLTPSWVLNADGHPVLHADRRPARLPRPGPARVHGAAAQYAGSFPLATVFFTAAASSAARAARKRLSLARVTNCQPWAIMLSA